MTELLDASTEGRIQPGSAATTVEPVPSGSAPQAVTESGLSARCRPLLRPTAYYLSSRVIVFAVAIVMSAIYPKLRVLQTLGSIWDGRWYLKIAQYGYPHHLVYEGNGSRWAFFPAFPAAVR